MGRWAMRRARALVLLLLPIPNRSHARLALWRPWRRLEKTRQYNRHGHPLLSGKACSRQSGRCESVVAGTKCSPGRS